MLKKIIIPTLCIIGAAVLFAGITVLRYERILSAIELQTPDLSQIQDGTFNGVFSAILVSADVDVTVENHRITEIVINRHSHGRRSAVEAESVINDVIFMQSLEVNTISGATGSSKVILSAIENALLSQ